MASSLSVSNFLANPAKSAAISDSAVNVVTGLAQLQVYAGNIKSIALIGSKPVLTVSASEIVSYSAVFLKISSNYSITLADATTPTLTLSWAQYSADASLLSKISASSGYHLTLNNVTATQLSTLGGNSHVSSLTIADTAANVVANLAAFGKYTSKVSSVTIADTAAHLTSSLNALESGVSKLNQLTITLTDSAVPVLKLTAAQLAADASVLKTVVSPFTIQISDTAQNISKNLTTLETYSAQIASINLTGSTSSLSLSSTQFNANSDALAEISSPYNLTLSGATGSPLSQISEFTMRAPAGLTGAVTLTVFASVNGGAAISLGAVTTTGSQAVQFQPQNLSAAAGGNWKITVTATDAHGTTAPGQIEMSAGYFSGAPVNIAYASSVNIQFLSVSATGVVSGLPKAYSATDTNYYVLESASGSSVSASALAAADKGSSVLHKYILAGRVAVQGVTGAVQPDIANTSTPSVTVNTSTVIPDLGNPLNAGQYAIMASIPSLSGSATVQMWLSDGSNNTLLGSKALSSTQTYAGFSGADLSLNGVLLSTGTGSTGTSYKLFFTDASGNGVPGNAVSGLQLAVSSASGGASTPWISAPATASSGITLEVGTVAQILAYVAANPKATSWYFIEDSISHIQSASAALSSLVSARQVVGAYISGGIAPAANGYILADWPGAIQIGSSSQYVREFGSATGNWQTHTILAVPTTDSNTQHIVQLYDNGVALGSAQTLVSDGSSALGVALPSGVALNSGSSNYLTATLDGVAVNLGIVSPAGGLPASYAGGINAWVGSVSQLPTSLSAIAGNTLYVLQDSAANLIALGSSAIETGVALDLAASGQLVFEVVGGGALTSYQQQLIEANNLSLLNLSALTVKDTLLGLEHVPVINSGDSLLVSDDAAHLLYDLKAVEGQYPVSGTTGQINPLATAHAVLTDTVAVLTNAQNQTALQGLHGVLQQVVVSDTVADFTAAGFNAEYQALQTFSGGIGATLSVVVQDSLANIQAAFAQNGNQLIAGYTAGVDVVDNVGNLEAAYANGSLSALQAAVTTTIKLDVKDNLSNLSSLFNSSSELGLISHLQDVSVVDTAQNIANGFQSPGSGLDPLRLANSIIIQDSYANVLAASQSNANLLGEVSEINLSSGATTGQAALQVSLGATANGTTALPELVLSFMSGALSATETSDGNGGTLVTINDTHSHTVSIDLIGVVDSSASANAYIQGGWYHG
jgi:hypothetical protein